MAGVGPVAGLALPFKYSQTPCATITRPPELGEHTIDVLRDFTPLVERISIDEAFLDVSGALHLFSVTVSAVDAQVEQEGRRLVFL